MICFFLFSTKFHHFFSLQATVFFLQEDGNFLFVGSITAFYKCERKKVVRGMEELYEEFLEWLREWLI